MPVEPFPLPGGDMPIPGTVCYETALGTPYHAMLIAPVRGGTPDPKVGSTFGIYHMAPPLEAREKQFLPSGPLWKAYFSELSDQDLTSVIREADRLVYLLPIDPQGRKDASKYDLSAHGVTAPDPYDPNASIYVRASCASFVEHCYEQIEADLVDEQTVPLTEQEQLINQLELRRAYQHFFRSNLDGISWPCAVLLPAYQLRAFVFDDPGQAYNAALTDHPFPLMLACPAKDLVPIAAASASSE